MEEDQVKRAYLLNMAQLRLAWRRHGQKWIRNAKRGVGGYSLVTAPNRGYVSRSVAVPADVLLGALADIAEPTHFGD